MELPILLDVISGIAVIIGVVLGLIQLRQFYLSRKRESALLLLHSYKSSEFTDGIRIVFSIPNGLTKNEIDERLREDIKAVFLVISTWESIGILVYRNEVTMDMVDDAFSGPIIISWQKLQRYVFDMREEHQRQTIMEWFQWLAEQMRDREISKPPVPAYIASRE